MALKCTGQARPKERFTRAAQIWLFTQRVYMHVGRDRPHSVNKNEPARRCHCLLCRTFAHGLNESSQPIHVNATLAVSSKTQCNKL